MLSDSLYDPPVYFGYFEDGTLLYYQQENGTVTFYTFDSLKKQISEIGSIERYVLDTGVTAMLEDSLYFYAGILDSQNEIRNTLFSIDLSNKTISSHENPDLSLPGINAYSFGDSIATLKNKRDGNVIETYLDFYNIKNETWEKRLSNEFNEVDKTGSALYVMYSDENNLYFIQDIYTNQGKCDRYLIQYDRSFSEKKKIPLQGELLDFIENSNARIVELKIWGDYLYLRDLSGSGFLGKIEAEGIDELKTSRKFICAASLYPDSPPVFFIRDSNMVFVLDVNTGELSEFTLKARDGHSISQIWSTDNGIFISAWNETRLYHQIFSSYSEISELEI